MHTKIIEATNEFNHGKFMVGMFDSAEWAHRSHLHTISPSAPASPHSLLASIGHGPGNVWVLDLQTCEGATFRLGGSARADLDKHRIWVCPMFEPFLTWLYRQPVTTLEELHALPDAVQVEGESALYGYRRPGVSQ